MVQDQQRQAAKKIEGAARWHHRIGYELRASKLLSGGVQLQVSTTERGR